MKQPLPPSPLKYILPLGVFIGLIFYGLALYHVPLKSAGFYFDDSTTIVNNQAIRTVDIPKIFDTFNTRFLVGLTFALNYHWDALHPASYRLVNLLIHCFNAFLVYLLIKLTLNLYPFGKPLQGSPWAALFGAVLFLCHPLQTEAVNFITQRFVLMGSFFYLLTLVLYIQYRCRSQKRYLFAAIVAAIADMFCKEFVVTLPLMLAVYEFYFFNHLHEPLVRRCKTLAPFFVIVLIVPFLLSRTSLQTVGTAAEAEVHIVQEGQTQKIVGNDITRARGGVSRHQYFLTELNVLCTYVRLLWVPIHQNLDYDYPLASGLDGKTALSGVFLLCLLALSWKTYNSYRLISFGILWFFIALSVESSVIPIEQVITEYRPYMASVGFVLLVMELLYRGKIDLKIINVIAAVILIGFSILTYQRNKIWRDDFTLWNDTVKKSPHKSRPLNNRGKDYMEKGNASAAMADFNEAIKDDPQNPEAYNNRGTVYNKLKDYDKAILDFNKAIELHPTYSSYYNQGCACYFKGDYVLAITDFNKSLELNPSYILNYIDLGQIYNKEGDFAQAILNFNKAIELDGRNADTYLSRGNAYSFKGDYDQAISDFNKALELKPGLAEAYNNRGDIYLKTGQESQAMSDFNKAIELKPEYADAYSNRASIYKRHGDLDQAILDLNKSIELDPGHADTYLHRGTVYTVEGRYEQSLADYNKAIQLNPDGVDAYNDRGYIYNITSRSDQALPDFNKAIELNPKFAEAYNNRGIAYENKSNWDAAIQDFNKTIELDPSNASAYLNRGNVYNIQGSFADALADYNKVIELNPNFVQVYKNRAKLLYKQKEYTKAWADLQKAEELGAKINPTIISTFKNAAMGTDN